MKLKKLSCSGLRQHYDDAYIVYEKDQNGISSFELVAVCGKEKMKIADTVNKLPIENLVIDVTKKKNGQLRLKDVDTYYPYELIFNNNMEAQDVYNKYSERVSHGCSPNPNN